ncbi:MAG: alkaline phosphatase family protein [Phycisphaeraceae bacterium]|nr:alkaline phosphatase family protein [Phycisphaeraceae bacterium]
MFELDVPPPHEEAPVAATLATGMLADAHGILTNQEPRDDLLGVRPASSTTRRRAALWEIAAAHGRSAAAVGWPSTHPAQRPIRASGLVVVTPEFAVHRSRHPDIWPLPSDCIQPEALREELASLRICAPDITAEQLAGLAPALAEIDQDRDDSLIRLAAALATCATIHGAATRLAENPPDLLCVHISFAADVARPCAKMRDRSLRTDGSSPLDEVPGNALTFLDLLVGRYMNLCGPESTYIICLDGPSPSAHAQVVMHGPSIKPGQGKASWLDIVPTILAMLGLPLASDSDGKPIEAALRNAAPSPSVWTHAESLHQEALPAPAIIAGIRDDLSAQGYTAPPRIAGKDVGQLIEAQKQALRSVLAQRGG